MPGIAFTHPWYLLLFPVLAYLAVWLARRSMAALSPERARVSLALRMALLLLAVVALAGPTAAFPAKALEVLFLLDRSASIPQESQARQLELVNQAAKQLPPDTRAGVMVFGKDALLERMPETALSVKRIHSTPGNDGSDLAAALRVGSAVLSEDVQRRLVVVSDGNQTAGDAQMEAQALAAGRVPVDVVPVKYSYAREALLERVVAPKQARKGEPLEIRVIARASAAMPATLRLLRDGAQVAERRWELQPGVNANVVPQSILQPGFHTWEAVLEPAGDTLPENNRVLGFTHVQGEPRVLLVEGKPGDAADLERTLRDRKLRAQRFGVAGLPTTLAEFRNYDSVVLVNVRADQVTPEQMKLVRSAVQDLGTGLLMVGGEDSLTAGGWHGTPVEEALPVDMEVVRRKEEPALALVLVIDHSGSMSGAMGIDDKLAFAKRASQGVLTIMRPEDEVGVVAFDDGQDWVVPLKPLAAGKQAHDGIDSIGGGGGTNMYPALESARRVLAGSKAGIKHVLVLTDGHSMPGDFEGVAKRMLKDKITMSTVGVGREADRKLLSRLAMATGGRHYPAVEPEALPFIFDRETRLAARSALVEETFRPRITHATSFMRDLSAPPPLMGYVATTAKQAASLEVPLVSHRNEPIVATWRFGLGRSVAVTTDAKARWAAPWLVDGGGYFSTFWAQAVRSTLRTTQDDGLDLEVAIQSGEGRVSLEALNGQGQFRNGLQLEGRVAGPGGGVPLRLEQTGPGRYEGRFPATAKGQYLVSLAETSGSGNVAGLVVAGTAVSYPAEYAAMEPDTALLQSLATRTGGQMWPELGPALHGAMLPRLFRPSHPARSAPQELWAYFLVAAVLLLPVDIGVRRLNLDRKDFAAVLLAPLATVRERLFGLRQGGPQEESMGRLLQAKGRVAVPADGDAPVADPTLRYGASASVAPSVKPAVSVSATAVSGVAPEPNPPVVPAAAVRTAEEAPAKVSPVSATTEGGMGRLRAAKRRASEVEAEGNAGGPSA